MTTARCWLGSISPVSLLLPLLLPLLLETGKLQ
jgi:hypothetical protein